MAEELDNLVLSLLREMRADVKDVREVLRAVRGSVASHDRRFDALDEKVEMIREGTVSAVGFAAYASRAHVELDKQIADPARRVEKLEKAR
jgi:hypothetical protein